MIHFARRDAHNYPLDLDGSLRYTRPFGVDYFPYPTIIGSISGILREFDRFVWATGVAKTPYGPDVNRIPINYDYQVAIGGLTKVSPNASR